MISLLILTHHKPPYSLATIQVIFPLFCSQVSFHPNISQYSLYFHFSWSHCKKHHYRNVQQQALKMPQTHGFIFQHFGCIIMLYSPITLEIIVLWINIFSMIRLKSLEVSEVSVAQSCLTLSDPKDYTTHGILQVTVLEWVAVPFSRGSFQPRDQSQVFHIAGGFFMSWTMREAQEC